MSTDKLPENTNEHFPSDALIAIGATVSVLVLGAVLQFLSPKSENIATESSAVSESMTTEEETASTTDPDGASLEMTTSELVEPDSEMTEQMQQVSETNELVEPDSEMTEQMQLVSETNSFISEPGTETVAAAPMMQPAASTITDAATLDRLNSQVFTAIDQNWRTTPTFTANLVYQVKVTETGAIASYEAITKSAKDYSNEIPLPSLTESDSNSEKMANFVVVFTPGGKLEVSPWVAN